MLFVADVSRRALARLLHRYALVLVQENDGVDIPASFWGDSEAGIVGHTVYVRGDTPVHSLLHETCHIICMTSERRAVLNGNAGGTDLEEAAVCYLQILLADHLHDVGQDQLMLDMDAWGYSYRLGNTRDWFRNDAEDAAKFLINHGLLTPAGEPVFTLRQ